MGGKYDVFAAFLLNRLMGGDLHVDATTTGLDGLHVNVDATGVAERQEKCGASAVLVLARYAGRAPIIRDKDTRIDDCTIATNLTQVLLSVPPMLVY